MEIGDKIFTNKYIAEVIELRDNNMYGVNFNSRCGSERNYNIVSQNLIDDMVAEKEWYIDNDPFEDR